MWEKERKKKEDKIVLIVVLVLQFDPFRPHMGGDTISPSWSIESFPVAVVFLQYIDEPEIP